MNKRDLEKTCKGYTLYGYADFVDVSYLVDMEGKIVKEWPFGGFPVKMLPGGSLLCRKNTRIGKNPLKYDAGTPSKETGPLMPPWQDIIELIQVDWNNNIEWSFSNWDDDGTGVMMARQHHDIQREGNPVGYFAPGHDFVEKGTTLILSHKNILNPEICEKELLDDAIFEIDWEGNLTGFKWYGADHFEEYGFDESAKKMIMSGVNFDKEKGYFDWIHINSASFLGDNQWYREMGDDRFNPKNIIISSRSANFIAIISYETGNIVWKAGPDFVEGTDEFRMGQLVGQHHAHMIPKGLPGEGNILIFDNGGKSGFGGESGRYPRYTRQYSRVTEINPVTFEIVWEYGTESGDEHFFSHFISGMQRLPNGNTMVTDGTNGRLFEVTMDKELIWEHMAPAVGDKGNKVYRAYRIPPEWVPGNPAGYPDWA
jgi:hypothetical protein